MKYLICTKHGVKKATANTLQAAITELVKVNQKGAYILDVTGGHPNTWKVIGERTA